MKKKIIFLVCLISLASCQQKEIKNEQTDNQIISLKFSDKINGYSVSGIFKPAMYRNEYSGIQGPAILTFKKDNEEFTVIHELYSLHLNKEDFEIDTETNKIKNIKVKEVTDSLIKRMDEFFEENTEEYKNFLFTDANFDGNKDIVLIEERNGNKTEIDYKFIFSNGGGFYNEILKGNAEDVEEPFTMITEVAKIDRANKEITFPTDGEDYASGSKTYKALPKDFGSTYSEFKLVKQEKGKEY